MPQLATVFGKVFQIAMQKRVITLLKFTRILEELRKSIVALRGKINLYMERIPEIRRKCLKN